MSSNIPFVDSSCEIVTTRVLGFAIYTVFDAWADPEKLKRWWGPAGFTNTFHEFDFRVGGHWKFDMHGPEKGTYPNEVVFEIIDAPNLVVWNRISKPLFRIATSFEQLSDDQTKLIFRMQFESEMECNKLKPFVVDKNEENFDRVETLLAER